MVGVNRLTGWVVELTHGLAFVAQLFGGVLQHVLNAAISQYWTVPEMELPDIWKTYCIQLVVEDEADEL